MVADPGGDDPDPNQGPAVKKKKTKSGRDPRKTNGSRSDIFFLQ